MRHRKKASGSGKVKSWKGAFSLAKKGQKFKKYPVQIKEKAVKLYYENMLPINTISSLLSIDRSRISLWIKNYEIYGTVEKKRGRPKKREAEDEMERLRAENDYLKLLLKTVSSEKEIKKKTKAEIIEKLRDKYTVKLLCEIAGISRSAYYRAINRVDKDEEIREKITDIYYKHKGIYGYRRITIELNRAGYRINHKKVYRIMKEEELYAVIRKKNKQKAAAMGVMKCSAPHKTGEKLNTFLVDCRFIIILLRALVSQCTMRILLIVKYLKFLRPPY